MAKITIGLGFLVLQSILLFGTVEAQNNECTTPRQLAGLCVPIRDCQPLLAVLTARPLSQQNVQYLRNSQCGITDDNRNPKVCCPLSNNIATERPNFSLRNNPLLPTDCGSDLSLRIVGGEITALDEFPWMVLLEYDKPNGKTTACGGVLVSSRYVLTAAHCIKGRDLPRSWTLNAVRLGEYDTSRQRDCVQDGEDSEICADDPVTVRIEEQIVHESYRPNSRDQRNDLALLRLAQNVQSTNYIKPICLPASMDLTQKLWVAGWGKTENKSESSVKLKLGISAADPRACSQRYSTAGINIGETQLCAGGQRGKDSCRGDSGGPLMSLERTPQGQKKWAVVGIVSFGPTPCGMQNWPGVYTRIVDYVPWILTKIRA